MTTSQELKGPSRNLNLLSKGFTRVGLGAMTISALLFRVANSDGRSSYELLIPGAIGVGGVG